MPADCLQKAFKRCCTAVEEGYLFDWPAGDVYREKRGGATGRKAASSDTSIALVALVLDAYIFQLALNGLSSRVFPGRER